MMIRLELLLDEDHVETAKKALREIGVKKMLLSEVKEYDEEHTHIEGYRGSTYVVDFVQKTKMEILLTSEDIVDRALHILSVANIDTEAIVYSISNHYHVTKRES